MMKKLLKAFDVRDLIFAAGLASFAVGLHLAFSIDVALIGAGLVLIFAALRK